MGAARYTAFGEMAVTVDDVRHPLTRRRERSVLSVLLAAHGAPVAAERVVSEVWGEESAGQTLAALQVAVSRLRSLLEPGRAARTGTRVVSTAAGYSLRAETDDVDTWRFEAAAGAALEADGPAERLALSDRALEQWTGPPYADHDSSMVGHEVTRLEELRLALHEHRARALLALGRPEEALRSLAELAPRHPFRERLWAQLALAQYQCSRQAEALETLRILRERLADELGVDPSEEVQQLEQAVLRQEPSLAAPPAVETTAPRGPAVAGTVPRPVAAPSALAGTVGTVGREDVLAGAAALVRSAATADGPGAPRFLLLAGEPGIGKSRLVEDLVAVADGAGARTLVGRCHDGDYAPALWPWLGIVRDLVAATGDPDPLLVPLLDDEVGAEVAGRGSGLRMFDAVVSLVTRSAEEQPLLLVLEDIHWADTSSLQLLRHLAGTAASGRLAVVCTRRTTEARTSEDLVDAMAALARSGAERIRLDGVGTPAVTALLDRAVGDHDPRLDQVVAEVTGGNPFFVLQYARLLAASPDLDALDPAALPVPDGVRDVLRQRVSHLPEAGRQVLTAAAVLGPDIDPDLVAGLSGVALEDCLDLLDLSLAIGLVEERVAGYRFVHALARETLYAELSTARRMRLHDRAGRLLEERLPDGAVGADVSADIAHHSRLAAPLGAEHAERAARWLGRAAEVAMARHAHPEALTLWDQVLDSAVPGSETAAVAMCGRAGALLRLARVAEAREAVEGAIRTARSLGRPDLVARALSIFNSSGVWSWREHGVIDAEFVQLLRDAAAETDDPAQLAQVLATLQVELYYGWSSSDADEAGARSVELARESGDRELLEQVLLVRLLASWGPTRATERLAVVEELLALEPEGELEVFALYHLGGALYETFEVERSDEVMRRCHAQADALQHTGLEIQLAWWWFARAREAEAPDAEELGRRALEIHRASGYIASRDLEIVGACRLDTDAPLPDWVVAAAPEVNPGLRAMIAHEVMERGEPERARDLLGEPSPPAATEYSVLAGRCLRLLVLAGTGTPEEVRAALKPVLPYAGRVVAYGSVDHLGVVDHALAAGFAALGEAGTARRHAEVAVELNTRLGCRPWLRRSDELLARLSRPAG
ncbi:MAG: AAA family ATPase [Marmoricola sp.]|nr:AAA family ATPase [Marmoricola sp.]